MTNHSIRLDRRDFMAGATALAATSALWPATSQAQSWPAKQVTLIVPFPPGGQADLAARPVAEALQRHLAATIIVDNRGGAAGAIGNAAVAKAAPDGQTLLVTLTSLAVLPEAARMTGKPVPYETSQLLPIARILADPVVLAVNPKTEFKTLDDFIAAAREKPGTISYGSSGHYGTLQIPMEMFATTIGLKLVHVAYRGAGPALNDVIAGHVHAAAVAPGLVRQQVDAGNLRVLACWGAQRAPSFPETPTFQELGYKDVEFYNWAGLFAPAGLPPALVDTLRKAMRDVMADAGIRETFQKAGSAAAYLDQDDFKAFIDKDSERLIAVVQRMGKLE